MSTSSRPLPELAEPLGTYGRGDLVSKKYRLVELIGAGGMGTVWVAHDCVLDVDVALKLIRFDQYAVDPQRIYQRLLQEARAAARLKHPAIVRVFDFGMTEQGSPFIAMELLRGESLAQLIAREHALAPARAVQLLLPIVDALSTAHGRQIIHRDIKPENLFLARDEFERVQPKLVDFGVARFLEGGRTMTRSGSLMGTPDYMAPEQAAGDPEIDHRADVWSLCVVLYELVSGTCPFGSRDDNYLAILNAIVNKDPKPLPKDDDSAASLWLIIERGLRKRREDRWDTMRVLGEALALWLYESGVREDILGAAIKTTWLQSGLGGVRIETASMSPPANRAGVDPYAGQPIVSIESGDVYTAGAAPISPPPPVPKLSDERSSSDELDSVPISVVPPASSVFPLAGGSVRPSERPSLAVSRKSAPLIRQTRRLQRLILLSIGLTAVLAVLFAVNLYSQHRTGKETPIAQNVRPPEAVVPERAPKQLAPPADSAAAEPRAPASVDAAPAVSSPKPEAVPAPARTAAVSRAHSPKRRPKRGRKSKYDLGF